jgi:hypothetical protein
MPSELFWILFTVIPLAVFAVAQTIGLRNRGPYTGPLRKWLGIEPRRKNVMWLWVTVAALWTTFVIWLPLHVACVWPWENC